MLLIAVTGWSGDEERRKSQLAGFEFHLAKPVGIEAVEALLRR